MPTAYNPVNSEMKFSDYHLTTAKVIKNEITSRNLKKLGKVIHSIPKADYWGIIYAYYNLYGISFNSEIQSITKDSNELMKYGLT